jgi:hypothetical protein
MIQPFLTEYECGYDRGATLNGQLDEALTNDQGGLIRIRISLEDLITATLKTQEDKGKREGTTREQQRSINMHHRGVDA